uniref:EvC ciliary complex subunit 2 n=1 Tax=Leptobrachium leishanense TaxID=445787 RepID=A0A8C5P7M8_9ANUR
MGHWMASHSHWHTWSCPFGYSLTAMYLLLLYVHLLRVSSYTMTSSLLHKDGISCYAQFVQSSRPTEDNGVSLCQVWASLPPRFASPCSGTGCHSGGFDGKVTQGSVHKLCKTEKTWRSHTAVPGQKMTMRAEDFSSFLRSSAPGSIWSHSVFGVMSSWMIRSLFKWDTTASISQRQDVSAPSNGLIFQKCATINSKEDPQTANISLITNYTDMSPSAANLSNVILRDDIKVVVVKDVSDNNGSSVNGTLTYTKELLNAGEYFLIRYTASLNMSLVKSGMKISLPAQLTYQNSTQNTTTSFKLANFTITAKENLKVVPNHGLHGAGFVIAFFVCFIFTCAIFAILFCTNRFNYRFTRKFHKINCEEQSEQSQYNMPEGVNEDFLTSDRMIDILAFEESDTMLQALDDSEIANLNHADAYLEACRMHICKDLMEIMLRCMTTDGDLSSQEEKRLIGVLTEHWLNLEKRIQEEHQRKMVALTAECNLDTRKQMDMQHRKQKAASEEAEELLKHVGEKSFTEYRLSLEKLHGSEQTEMKRLLLCKQEEEFAKAYRQLSILHRREMHNIFYEQMQDSASMGKIVPEVQKAMIENYSKIQVEQEDLLDFMQAIKKYHLTKRLAVRKNMIYNVQLCDSRSRCLLNTAATQIASLINKTERAGHMTESQAELLLQKAQAEVLKVKQKLENVLKTEKRKLHQKLGTRRKRHLVQKLKEQKKEQGTIQEVCRSSKEVKRYLEHWKKLFSDQCQELEEVFEQHDNDAVEELKVLKCNLTEKAIEDLYHIQNAVIMQEMLKLNVPRTHLQQVIEEHKRETARLAQQLEKEETDKANESRTSLESTKRKLDDELKLTIKEQKNLRHWEQLLFTRILLLPLSMCNEDVHKIRKAFQSGFSQMDITLALPKIQGRRLLQTYLAEWRREQLDTLDHRLVEMEKQSFSKTRKHPQDKTVEVLKKSVEDKILIYEAQITDDKIKQARAELLLQRVHQLKAREYKLGEFMTSIQFQLVNDKSKALEIHSALLHLQSLLLEEISRSQIVARSEYEQILDVQSHEIKDIDQNLKAMQKEVANNTQVETDPMNSLAESNEETNMPLSTALRAALNKRKHVTNLIRDRMQKEEMEYALFEDQEEKAEMNIFLRLYNQDIRLAAYLTRRARLPEEMLHRILNLLLPSSMENEILSVLYSVGHKYSGGVTETDSNEDEADSWQESILKKKRLRPVKRVSFSQTENFSKLLQSCEPFGSTEAINIPDSGENLFIFTAPTP